VSLGHRRFRGLSIWLFRLLGWTENQTSPLMKYPLHTQSQPVSGEAAKKLLEAIDSGSAVVNDRVLALAKRIAARRRKSQKHA
jgi:hypothetical protein